VNLTLLLCKGGQFQDVERRPLPIDWRWYKSWKRCELEFLGHVVLETEPFGPGHFTYRTRGAPVFMWEALRVTSARARLPGVRPYAGLRWRDDQATRDECESYIGDAEDPDEHGVDRVTGKQIDAARRGFQLLRKFVGVNVGGAPRLDEATVRAQMYGAWEKFCQEHDGEEPSEDDMLTMLAIERTAYYDRGELLRKNGISWPPSKLT
jgi:hypothetical protein